MKRLKVGVIATVEERFHRAFCAEMARRFDVVGVVHPARRAPPSSLLDLSAHRKAIRAKGLALHALAKLGDNKIRRLGFDLARDTEAAEAVFFPSADKDYDRFAKPRARHVADLNAPEGVALLKALGADVVLNSGGPILKGPAIAAAPLMLNFHTGISPLYNGASSIFWTFANGQPHVTGGTLMVMNEVVDGGAMLAHYMPSVEAGDTPGRQFCKTIRGGVELYARFLGHLAEDRPFVSAPQGKPFHYTTSADWTVHQNLMIERRVARDVCAKFVRPERIRIYWDAPDTTAARRAVEETLLGLVYDA